MGPVFKPGELAGMPLDDRLALVEAIWDSIADDAELLPVPDWHGEELDRRVADHAAEPHAGEPWEDVKRRLMERLQR